MKIAPIMAAFRSGDNRIPTQLVHTGQHYDAKMKDAFFVQLGIPEPDVDLGVGSGSHAVQTAEIMKRFEQVVDEARPSAVLVVGDVNSTIACALVASKKGVPVVHVEAGLRSYDRRMPEEVNRVLTDQISDLLFTTERSAHKNLEREGIDAARIHFVGNVMIDTLHAHLPRATSPAQFFASRVGMDQLANSRGGYALLTLHRPSNVDNLDTFRGLIETVRRVSEDIPVLFAVHPRTEGRMRDADLLKLIESAKIVRTEPLGYLDMLGLMAKARFVLTDSGGIQEETTALGVPCITLRENTERPITADQGTNTVAGTDPACILACVKDVIATGGKAGRQPEFWDGQAALRIKSVLHGWLANGSSMPAAK